MVDLLAFSRKKLPNSTDLCELLSWYLEYVMELGTYDTRIAAGSESVPTFEKLFG